MPPAVVEFKSFAESVPEVLDAAGAPALLAGQAKILLKPNLVFAAAHPVTTAADCCLAVIDYIRAVSSADIVIAEGSGDPGDSTDDVFAKLGYARLARSRRVKLLELNTAPCEHYENSACPRLPEIYLPAAAETHFIISLPVLKAHTLSGFSGSLKNMMGFAPPAHYAGAGGIWNKAALHRGLQQAIIDLNRYRSPDLTLMDASIGLPDQHLGGRHCDPPVGKLMAGADARAVDRASAALLGLDWERIDHLT
ncbi:MAG: DUF362 domain-containing protein [Thermodesulfobacteriota bacterium]